MSRIAPKIIGAGVGITLGGVIWKLLSLLQTVSSDLSDDANALLVGLGMIILLLSALLGAFIADNL